ncbi:uncharacterized protein N7477_001266 [Penicillium maclennaniae]|uniref:uncharacterized protein n=1 Tax=Penicillium maclennaniae TaxID=1343394 RepID=UPI0025415D5C|nr:uncharacterized protein N7477_001266 [Penicillium maclennaniae]KAJ5681326.1 hypothetical protein N7477_001266 [Penicillium maclennaniae]
MTSGPQPESLELVATIKASQIASNLDLLEVTSKTISTRLLVQAALRRYYEGNTSASNWASSITDVQSALGGRGYLDLYQAILFARSGEVTQERLLSVTSATVPEIVLPYTHTNGSKVLLGSDDGGYPPSLYPNLTYTKSASDNSITVHAFPDYPLGLTSALLLGPLRVNDSFSSRLVDAPHYQQYVGHRPAWFYDSVITSRDGLGNTGQILLIGPSRAENTFASSAQPATATTPPKAAALAQAEVHYVFEPTPLPGQSGRHRGISTDTSWPLSKYKMALKLMLESYENENKSISELSTTNEEGYNVAVGAVRPASSLVQWILIVEETHNEAFSPVARLRKIILACVFGTAGLIILMVPILTHFAVAPIRRLRAAAQKSVKPEIPAPLSNPQLEKRDSQTTDDVGGTLGSMEEQVNEKGRPAIWAKRLRAPLHRLNSSANVRDEGSPRLFQIPGRVKERNHCVTDELTELTKTFNEMSDELTIQYTRLEERVAERTRELEKAKLAAETANESKTLFIANISHELKTPLNGILGMCAVCMGEDDLSRIKKSLQVVYQSGDLLLHLLNDLLTFSKNQIEQAIQLEEKEFKLSDIRSQIAIIFQNQVHEKQIDFSVTCMSVDNSQHAHVNLCLDEGAEGTTSASHPEAGNLMNMVLWGDQHRILQVLINLVSNSLKFTPENGRVQVRIRCVEDETGSTAPIAARRTSRLPALNRPNTQSSTETTAEPRQSLSDGRQLMFYFEVEDNGPGIPAHLHRRIFDPFVQGDLGLNRKYGGTGLGLSICA